MKTVLTSILPSGVAIITLNDDKNLNAMSEQMAVEFKAAVQELKERADLRAVILTGSGKAFSAGGHLQMLEDKQALSSADNHRQMLVFYDSFLSILSLDVPLIAAINGAAVGAGLCLACACDIRVASSTAKMGFTFLKIGLHPGMGATFFLPRLLGRSRATELLLTGRIFSAAEAYRLGLVSQVVEGGDPVSAAKEVADEILSCGPLATKQLLKSMRNDLFALKVALENEASNQSINYSSAEYAEGLAAIRAKRPANFR